MELSLQHLKGLNTQPYAAKFGPVDAASDANINVMQQLINALRDDVSLAEQRAKSKEDFLNKVGIYIDKNPILQTGNKELAENAADAIAQTMQKAMHGLPVGGTRDVYAETARQDTMDLIKNMGSEMKDNLKTIVSEQLEQGGGMREISQSMQDTITDMGKANADRIARTETVRAENLGRYYVADNDGYEAFVVYSAVDCCPDCADAYIGQVFTIDQQDMLPPLHPNCRCAAQFFRTVAIAEGMADAMNANLATA